MIRLVALALILAVTIGLAWLALLVAREPRWRRCIPTAAEITAMDEPTFARFLDRIGMTRRVKAALRQDEPSWGWER